MQLAVTGCWPRFRPTQSPVGVAELGQFDSKTKTRGEGGGWGTGRQATNQPALFLRTHSLEGNCEKTKVV